MTLVCEVAISCASDEWIVGSRGNFMSIILSQKVAFSAPTRDHHLMHAVSSKTSPVMCRHREGPDTLVAFAAFIECWVSTTTRWASVWRRDLERNTLPLEWHSTVARRRTALQRGSPKGPFAENTAKKQRTSPTPRPCTSDRLQPKQS
jgi:hypothetical protein